MWAGSVNTVKGFWWLRDSVHTLLIPFILLVKQTQNEAAAAQRALKIQSKPEHSRSLSTIMSQNAKDAVDFCNYLIGIIQISSEYVRQLNTFSPNK